MEKIYTTVGVYNNGDYKMNGVKESNLLEHIKYNLEYRPGRAFFVDGVCLHKGNLDNDRIELWEFEINNQPKFKMSVDTAPYI